MISLRLLVLQVLFNLLFVEFGLTSVSDVEWARYKARYKKRYGLEDRYHRRILEKRVQAVANHNGLYSQGRSGFRMGLNQLYIASGEPGHRVPELLGLLHLGCS